MCTRYSLHDLPAFQRLLKRFGLKMPAELRAIYNATLTTRMPAIVKRKGAVALEPLAFGTSLPPKVPGEKPLLLANARAETLLERGAFKDAAQHRRCLVPADGFYEWEKQGKARLPHYFQRRDGDPFFFAGLWRAETAISPPAFAIVTTTPNELVAPLHDRMPVMLSDDESAHAWLGDAPLPAGQLEALCTPFPADAMRSHRVDPRMNSARHEGLDCIAPFTPPPPERELFD
ncbi:MAG: SOS response-associated peptidase [Opitutae bacterium]|nr:SOS response-associated peptidase [Opitutae bacterium]